MVHEWSMLYPKPYCNEPCYNERGPGVLTFGTSCNKSRHSMNISNRIIKLHTVKTDILCVTFISRIANF